VLVTWGESISHIGDAGPQAQQTHGGTKVGYRYDYFGIFWIDFWTHGGTFCVYDEKRYAPLPPAEAARLLGTSDSSLSSPFLYKVPLGWLIVGPLILIWAICARITKRRDLAVDALFQDARYQKALGIVSDHLVKQSTAAAPEQGLAVSATAGPNGFPAAFEAAVQCLVDDGIPREEAEQNLRMMVLVLSQASQEASAPAQDPPANLDHGSHG